MKLTTVRKAIPVALIMAGALGLSSNANASAYAIAYNNIFDLNVTSFLPVPIQNFQQFAAKSIASANLDGSGTSGSDNNGGPADVTPRFGDLSVFDPGPAPANNAMTQQGQSGNYAYADAQVGQTALLNVGGVIIPTGQLTQAWGIAEAYVDQDGDADSDSRNSSETGFFTTIFSPGNSVFAFDFNASPYMFVELANALGVSSNAFINVTISISSVLDGVIFEWKPDGTASGPLGGTEVFDPFSLNGSLQVTSNAVDGPYDPSGSGAPAGDISPATFGNFRAFSDLLVAPGVYTISLNMTQGVNLSTVHKPPEEMPEPGVLALFGMGLAGLGFFRRRKVGHS